MEIEYYKTIKEVFKLDVDKLVDLILSDNKEEIEKGNIDLLGLLWEFEDNEMSYFTELGFDGDYHSLDGFEDSDEEKELITIIEKKIKNKLLKITEYDKIR